MGKPGGAPARKAPGTAVNTRNGQRAVLTIPGERFDPPDHIKLPEALDAWEDYWADPVSSVITQADHSLLIRWVDHVQRYWELIREADSSPTVESGANGVLSHPLYKTALAVENQIERMELKLGIGPKNRAALGIQILHAENAAADRRRPPAAAYRASVMDADEDPRMQ